MEYPELTYELGYKRCDQNDRDQETPDPDEADWHHQSPPNTDKAIDFAQQFPELVSASSLSMGNMYLL